VTGPARRSLVQLAVIALALVPAIRLAMGAATDGLGANPIEEVTHTTGRTALRLLLATLAVTPARQLLGWSWLAPLRRTLGLLAFGYACLHLLTWLALDHFFDWELIVEDVLERRYVTAGMLGFACLLPLAITSTRGWMRRLGRRWQILHRLVYAAGIAGVVHFVWLVKADLAEPLAYAALLAGLLGYRAWHRAAARAGRASSAPSRAA
jgi:sulfoxide reductase heme-binding subunit YedZ